jgi:hypothetical protein
MRILRYRPSPAMVVALIALFVALGGVSYGVATGSIDSREIKNNTVRGKDIRNRTIRFRDVACPGGTRRYQVGCFESNVRGSNNWANASDTCGTSNRRLPSASELHTFRLQPGIVLAGDGAAFELSSNVHTDGAVQYYIGIRDDGAIARIPLGTASAFRCVTQLRG